MRTKDELFRAAQREAMGFPLLKGESAKAAE